MNFQLSHRYQTQIKYGIFKCAREQMSDTVKRNRNLATIYLTAYLIKL